MGAGSARTRRSGLTADRVAADLEPTPAHRFATSRPSDTGDITYITDITGDIIGLTALQAAAGNRAVTQLLAGAPFTERSVLVPPAHTSRAPTVQRDLNKVITELNRPFTDPDDPRLLARRAILRAHVGALDENQALDLALLLLNPASEGSVADRFQRLSSGTRSDLMTSVFGRLGHVQAEMLSGPLTTDTDPVAVAFRRRFRELVPNTGARNRLLKVLSTAVGTMHAPRTDGQLWVHWDNANFRTSGAFSPDNGCDKNDFAGLGYHPGSGQNVMELRGDVTGHIAGTQYDVKRTVERGTWWRTGTAPWTAFPRLPAGTPDDKSQSDEDLTPDLGHLYSMDGPGPLAGLPGIGSKATGYVYVASFVEWVVAKKPAGSWVPVSDEFTWHSSSAMEKLGGRWVRDWSRPNLIGPGAQPILEPER